MSPTKTNPRRPVILIIMDGVGISPSRKYNGFSLAHTPNLDDYFSRYQHTTLQASGLAVGLPDGQMGNSEVGHVTIGSGSVVRQDLVSIDDAINDGSFYENPSLEAAMKRAAEKQRPIHLLGLVSDGGVHSHVRHLNGLIELAMRYQVRPVVHMITDGRDTAPQCAVDFLQDIEKNLTRSGGKIATLCGRYFALDRDNRWDRVEKAWSLLIDGKGQKAESAQQAIEDAYARGVNDEFIEPTVIGVTESIQEDDEVIFFNYRKDRPRQLTAALCKDEFEHFSRHTMIKNITTMTCYDEWYGLPYAFEQERPGVTLGEVVSQAGLAQFHCAETEKYPHITYFLNGGRGDPYVGEDRKIIESPKVATYDLQPEMSAKEVADSVLEAILSDQYAFIAVNFANGDMVGHTAKEEAVIKAVETLDKEVGRVMELAEEKKYSVVLTADHGNCEEMVSPITGQPHTQHTVYPVPCLIMDKSNWELSIGAGLSSVAPTVLHLMGLSRPDAMQGRSLLLRPL